MSNGLVVCTSSLSGRLFRLSTLEQCIDLLYGVPESVLRPHPCPMLCCALPRPLVGLDVVYGCGEVLRCQPLLPHRR